MTAKLFVSLYVGLFVGMFVLLFANFPVGWIFFGFLFVAVFGGMLVINRPYIIAAGFLVVSLVVLGIGLWGVRQAVQAWATAPGIITRSRFCTQTVNDKVVYSGPCIDYRYRVNGQTFEAISLGTGELTQRWWSRIPDRYREGRNVQVYYDPGDPTISRLAIDIYPQEWVTIIVGAMMAALSAFTLFWVLLKRTHPPAGLKPAGG